MKNYRKAKSGDVTCGVCWHGVKPFRKSRRWRCYKWAVQGHPTKKVVSQHKTCDYALDDDEYDARLNTPAEEE